MKKLVEDLNLASRESSSEAAVEAKRLGLVYVGFGRYEDPITKQVTHIVQNERLVPFAKAIKTNDYKQNSADDLGKLAQALAPQKAALDGILTQEYSPENFSNEELDVIKQFTDGGYQEINARLNALPANIMTTQIVPDYDGDVVPDQIKMLDDAISRMKTPVDMNIYASVNENLELTPGSTIRFKGFRSGTIDPAIIMNSAKQAGTTSKATILQIKVPEKSNGLYAENFSANPEEYEFILPRGSKVIVTDGPNKLIGSNAQLNVNRQEIYYFNCELTN
jgi:hypothetical protein